MVGFVFILVGFSLVSAVACDDNQTIMRLYSVSNSHVSAWDKNTGTYLEEVCYNDVFGLAYGGLNPHNCTGDNRVLSLYSSSNSHASEISEAGYDYEVCYGDLSCVYDDSVGDSCSNDGEIVVRMSGDYNAHVSYGSDVNYPVKVCCATNGVYWKDMNGKVISEADFGDSVQMVAKGVVGGIFKIMEDDGLPFGIGDDSIRNVIGSKVGSKLVGVWDIKKEDLDKTVDYEEFYFEIGGKTSEYLAVNKNGDDDPMNITIVSPVCGEYFDEGAVVNIGVIASDADDEISGEVKVDGNVVADFSNGGITMSEVFSVPGNSQVVVEATNTKGEKSRVISNIMILDKSGSDYIDGKYVAACIASPKDFSNIAGSVIDFDASTTRGIRVSGGVRYLLVPSAGDIFSWTWKFMPESIVREMLNTTDPLAYKFTAKFPILGDNSASLKVDMEKDVGGTVI